MLRTTFATERKLLYNLVVSSQKLAFSPSSDCPSCLWRQHTPISGNISKRTLKPLVLPPTRPLLPELISIDVDRAIAERLSEVYERAVRQLRAECEVQHGRASFAWLRTCPHHGANHDTLELMLGGAYASNYARILDSWIEFFLDQAIRRADGTTIKQDGRSLRWDAIHILEQYYERDAFPTRAVKEKLALDAKIEVRQVHVWFQNRRQRARKTENLSMATASRMPFPQDLQHSVERILATQSASKGNDDGHADDPSVFVLNTPAPPHAYPSVYPPQCDYDPFPTRMSFHQGDFCPRHTLSNTRTAVVSSTSMDDLCDAFAGLQIGNDPREACPISPNPSQIGFGMTISCALPSNAYTDVYGRTAKPSSSIDASRTYSSAPVSKPRRSRKTLPFLKRSPSRYREASHDVSATRAVYHDHFVSSTGTSLGPHWSQPRKSVHRAPRDTSSVPITPGDVPQPPRTASETGRRSIWQPSSVQPDSSRIPLHLTRDDRTASSLTQISAPIRRLSPSTRSFPSRSPSLSSSSSSSAPVTPSSTPPPSMLCLPSMNECPSSSAVSLDTIFNQIPDCLGIIGGSRIEQGCFL